MKTLFCIGILLFGSCLVTAQVSEPSPTDMPMFDQWGPANCEDYLARMDGILVRLHEPGQRVVFVVYEGKTQEVTYKKDGTSVKRLLLPQYGLARTKIASMKSYLRAKGADLSRVTLISGGFREELTVEVFVVPERSEIQPVARPTVEKMKYRKGKPAGYCMGCCE